MPRNESIDDAVKDFEHLYNPLHFYARLRDMKVPEDVAMSFMKAYEKKIYSSISSYVKFLNNAELHEDGLLDRFYKNSGE